MFIRLSFRIFKPIVGYRSITTTIATLRISKDVTQKIECTVQGAPDYLLAIPKHVGNTLARRDLGSVSARKDLIFYDGRHFAPDRDPLSPRLTLTEDVAPLISGFDGGGGGSNAIPAVLYNLGELAGSGIALKGTEGEVLLVATAAGAEVFKKALRDMK
ncbi:MAG: hypothetical protein Q9184_003354 [Pyrenodesmia sp. 2 TL-2023]